MEVTLAPQVLFTLAGFDVTNTFLILVLISFLLILAFGLTTRKLKEVPKGLQLWLEVLIEGGMDFMDSITGDRKQTEKLFPFIMTMFLVFLVANFIPFIPGIGAITFNGVPIHRTATSDYSFVFTIASLSVILMQVVTVVTGGVWVYFTKYFNLSGPWGMKPINFFLGLMEIVSELAKVISLSFRLFGNMFAGEILAAVIAGLVPYIVPVPFALLGVLTALIQAAVFSILVLIFMSMAVVEKEVKAEFGNP